MNAWSVVVLLAALYLVARVALILVRRARRPRTFIARILEKGSDGTERPVVIGPACDNQADAEDGAWSRYERLCGVAVNESGAHVRPDRDARCVVREVT